MSRSRRELWLAVVGCLVGGIGALVAAGLPWVAVVVRRPAPGPGRPDAFHDVQRVLAGRDLAPAVAAWALLALAAVVAIPATRRIGRVLTGALVFAAGAIVAGLAAQVRLDPTPFVTTVVDPADLVAGRLDVRPATGLALLAGLLLAATGAAVAWRGRRWPELSRRYDGPGDHTEPAGGGAPEARLWDELDAATDDG